MEGGGKHERILSNMRWLRMDRGTKLPVMQSRSLTTIPPYLGWVREAGVGRRARLYRHEGCDRMKAIIIIFLCLIAALSMASAYTDCQQAMYDGTRLSWKMGV